ncbi:Glycoside hydrolase [Pseudozyma hubeiensis]|nr:Glycoside hydrolase [Pseudozyma hubeiensis]
MWPSITMFPITLALIFLTINLVASQHIVIDSMWSTTYNYSQIQEFSNPAIAFSPGPALTASVNVTASVSASSSNHDQIGIAISDNQIHQTVDSFGGGITDSVAIALQDFKTKHPKDYDDLLHLLFSQDADWLEKGGVGMNSVRVPLGASDFGQSPYTYDDTEDGSEDPELELFEIKRAPKLWATLRDILKVNAGVKIFVAAWSAPGWMKENTDPDQPLFGGNLKAGMEKVYAKYLIKSISEIKVKEQIEVYAMSPGNEPQIPKLKYPTMKISADQAIQLGVLLRSGLDSAGFKSVRLLAWDFNWDNTDYPLTVLNSDPTPWSGIAWHGYAGQPSAQKTITDAFPNLDTYFTEKTVVTQYFNEPYKNIKNAARDLLVGSIRYASKSIIFWNLVLRKDEDGFTSPHLPGVCENCNAAILLLPESTDGTDASSADANSDKKAAGAAGQKKDSRKKRGMLRRDADETVTFKPDPVTAGTAGKDASQAVPASKIIDAQKTGSATTYSSALFKRTSDLSVLSHLSTAVRPVGASKSYSKRIGVTSTDELTELGGRVLAQAFRQDGVKPGITRFSLILLNQNDHYETGVWEEATAVVAFRGMTANVTTVPGLYTLSWEAPTVMQPEEVPTPKDGGGSDTPGAGGAGSGNPVTASTSKPAAAAAAAAAA